MLAVCAGYQIVGNSFTVGDNDEVISGLGLLDVTTTRGPVRAVGEIISRWNGRDGREQWLTGFENHGGTPVSDPAWSRQPQWRSASEIATTALKARSPAR